MTTAAGASAVVPVDDESAGPVVIGAEDANGDGRDEVFVAEYGARPTPFSVRLFVYGGCALSPVVDADGEVYRFTIGRVEGELRGMGCVDADGDGGLELVGTTGATNSDTGETSYSRTIVQIDGEVATNGATDEGTFTSPGDDAAIETLTTATCGENLLDASLQSSPADE